MQGFSVFLPEVDFSALRASSKFEHEDEMSDGCRSSHPHAQQKDAAGGRKGN